jgi:hypothetical protein
MGVNWASAVEERPECGQIMAIGSSGLCQNRRLSNNGSSELYSQEEIFKKLSMGGSLKAEGFGDGLLTSIEYQVSKQRNSCNSTSNFISYPARFIK